MIMENFGVNNLLEGLTAPEQIREVLAVLIQEIPHGVYSINAQGIIDSFNPAMLDLAGVTDVNKVLGLNVFVLDSYKQAGLIPYFSDAINKGIGFSLPIVAYVSFTGKKQSYRSYKGIPLKDASGKVHHVLLFVGDVTEKVEIGKTLASLTKANEDVSRLAAIIERTPDCVVIVTPDENAIIQYWNKGGENLFGWSKEETVGKSYREIIVPEEKRKEFSENMKKVLEHGFIHGELARKHKNGNLIIVDSYIFTITDQNGVVKFIAAILRDITERKTNEEKLLSKDRDLEKINKLMVGRELRMIELKNENERLRGELEARMNAGNSSTTSHSDDQKE